MSQGVNIYYMLKKIASPTPLREYFYRSLAHILFNLYQFHYAIRTGQK